MITEGQRGVCLSQKCGCAPVARSDKVGLAAATLGLTPINGLRHPITEGTTGWYIWWGEQLSEAGDFFQPLCVDHLLDRMPAVADFLALPPGFRFLIHGTYRDIWFDEGLLSA